MTYYESPFYRVGGYGIRSRRSRHAPLVALITTALALAGCSEDDADPPVQETDAPTLTMTPTNTKTLRFEWDDNGAATRYRLLVNPDGASGYSLAAGFSGPRDRYDQVVFLPDRLNAAYMLEACNSRGCASSEAVYVSGGLNQAIGALRRDDNTVNGYFGTDVALSADGSTLAVGTPGDEGADGTVAYAGAVQVFRRDGADWSREAVLRADHPGQYDQLGEALALNADGTVLAAGAVRESSDATGINGDGANDNAANSGAAYVFRRDGDAWHQEAYIKADNTDAGDYFGFDLALSDSGDRLAVGAPFEASGVAGDGDDNGASQAGAVYLFHQDGGTWAQESYLKASNLAASDWFGHQVALSGDGTVLAANALREASAATGVNHEQNDDTAATAGAVYLFRLNGGWNQDAYIKASNTESADNFGRSLALNRDGDTLAVGANQEDSDGDGVDAGQADNGALSSGAAYVFRHNGSAWAQSAYVKAANSDADDGFGFRVALDAAGETLAVSAQGEQSTAAGIDGAQADNAADGAGAVYLFRLDGGVWTQRQYLKAPTPDSDDRFGQGLALAADGDTLAAGAPNDDGTGNGASNSGAVFVY